MLTAAGITLSAGFILFVAWDRLHNLMGGLHSSGPEAGYGLLLKGLARVAAWHTRLIQPGRLDAYLDVGIGLALTGVVATLSWARLIQAGAEEENFREDAP